MSETPGSVLKRYGVAIMCTAVAVLLEVLIRPLLGSRIPFVAFYPAVFVTALTARFGPTLLAVVLCGSAVALLFLTPESPTAASDASMWLGLILFAAFGLAVALLSELTHRRRWQVDEQRNRFAVTLANIDDAVVVADGHDRINFMNRAGERLTGWDARDASGRPLDDVFPIFVGAARLPLSEFCRRLAEPDRREIAQDLETASRSGQRCPVEVRMSRIVDRQGDVQSRIFVFRDVREERAAHGAMARLASLVDSSEDAIIGLDLEGRVTNWNSGAQQFYGYGGDEVLGRRIAEILVPGEPAAEFERRVHQIRDGERAEPFETQRQRRDRQIVEVESRLSPIRDCLGRVIGASLVDRDVSRQNAFQRQRLARLAVTQILMQDPDVNVAIRETLAAVGQTLRFPAAAYWRRDPQDGLLKIRETWCRPNSTGAEFLDCVSSKITFSPGVGLPGRAWRSGAPALIADLRQDSGFIRGAEAERWGLRGAVACPVTAGREMLGVLEWISDEVLTMEDELCELLTTIGNQLGQFIERKRSEESVKESERLYRAIGETIEYGVWISDAAGKAIYTSESFLKLVGMTQESCSDFGWAEALHPQERDETIKKWMECIRTQGSWYREHRVLGVDGEYHPILARGVPVRDDDGEVLCWAGINLDISELKRVENQLRDADRRKDEFLAMLAHELRNPIAPIRSGLDLLATEDGFQQEVIRVMQQQVDHIVRLVDDLMDVSRIMRGRIELRREPTELGQVIKNVIQALRPVLEGRDQRLTVDLPEEPTWLDADPVRLAQVLENLVTNSSKYSDVGSEITISVVCRGKRVAISVRDEGIGMSPEFLPRIFDLFTQSSRSLDRSQGGLGIGLTLVKRLVEMHGGTVSATSEGEGKGSDFVVTLPIGSPPEHEEIVVESSPTRERRIVVVDDHPASAWLLAELLRKLGNHRVNTAHDGHGALEVIRGAQPEIVFLDIGLPGRDGYEVCKAVRAIPELQDVLLVALTGYGQESDRRRALDAGFDEHLVKPPSMDQMKAVLSHPKLAAATAH